MQTAGHQVAILGALALYKSAAAAMRTMLETAMYFSYFRTHPVELATLLREPRFYLTKAEIIDFHKDHTPDFVTLQQRFDLLRRLNIWYGFVSSVIHGQVPGGWMRHRAVAELKHDATILPTVVKTFLDGEAIVHDFLLCTLGRELWSSFSSASKKKLLVGLSLDAKGALGLDEA
jgi:hypothetical protein